MYGKSDGAGGKAASEHVAKEGEGGLLFFCLRGNEMIGETLCAIGTVLFPSKIFLRHSTLVVPPSLGVCLEQKNVHPISGQVWSAAQFPLTAQAI
mmetsp:Transcript_26983/g.45319  ORF Transcript_26983/g.45319 Transcript_26983/m.45319 type:complete len:95 (+) Transcript_26983:1558-1842(+)